MANTIASKRNGIYLIESDVEVWDIKSTKHLEKFWRWIQRKKLIPGDIIPKRIFRKHFRRVH